jgi:hypothetical protein
MKTWVLEETGKMINPKSGINAEWILSNGNPLKSIWPLSNKQYPELKLTEYPSNPITELVEACRNSRICLSVLLKHYCQGENYSYEGMNCLEQLEKAIAKYEGGKP